jgi:hypothetical protein
MGLPYVSRIEDLIVFPKTINDDKKPLLNCHINFIFILCLSYVRLNKLIKGATSYRTTLKAGMCNILLILALPRFDIFVLPVRFPD